jgi:hypothetical protein
MAGRDTYIIGRTFLQTGSVAYFDYGPYGTMNAGDPVFYTSRLVAYQFTRKREAFSVARKLKRLCPVYTVVVQTARGRASVVVL